MVSPALLILHLVIAIAIILVCIIVLKLNASIGMVIACLYMGVMGGLGLMDTVSTISSGFGSMMTSIGPHRLRCHSGPAAQRQRRRRRHRR